MFSVVCVKAGFSGGVLVLQAPINVTGFAKRGLIAIYIRAIINI